jgi:hypothetical protein
MKVELFAACDFAADYAGKLTLVGVFDTLGAPRVPVVHAQLSVVAKLRFDDAEAGPKTVRLRLADADGHPVLAPIDLPIVAPSSSEGGMSVVNLVFNLGGICFERLGEHALDLSVDGVHAASTPLYLRHSPS